MPPIECAAKTCLHNYKGWCDVGSSFVNVNSQGHCLDHAPLTEEEEVLIFGHEKDRDD